MKENEKMGELIEQIRILAKQEQERASETFAPFISPHEGYSNLKEEVQETNENMVIVKEHMEKLWESIKADHMDFSEIDVIRAYATLLAAEAVQIVGVCDKLWKMDLKECKKLQLWVKLLSDGDDSLLTERGRLLLGKCEDEVNVRKENL